MHVNDFQAEWIFGYLKEPVHDEAGSSPPRIVLVLLDTTFSDMTIKKVYNRSGRIFKLIVMSWPYRETLPWTVRNAQSTLHSHTI